MVKLTSQIFLLEMKIKYLIDKQSINRSSLGFSFHYNELFAANAISKLCSFRFHFFSVSRVFVSSLLIQYPFWVHSAKAIAVPTSKWIKFQMKSGKYRAKGKNSSHTTNDRIVFQHRSFICWCKLLSFEWVVAFNIVPLFVVIYSFIS